MRLSNAIAKYSKQYGTDPYRSVAIAMQESSLRNVHRKQDFIIITETCDEENVCSESVKQSTGYTDLGIFQFHARTIKERNVDVLLLRDDVEYATEQHIKLLAEKKRLCQELGSEAYTCYHSKTPKYRELYKKAVEGYYNKIKKGLTND